MANVQSNLCLICCRLGRYNEAEKHGVESVEKLERFLGERHFRLSSSYCNLGILRTYQNKRAEATRLIESAYEYIVESLGEDGTILDICYEAFYALYHHFGEYDKAEEALLKLHDLYLRDELDLKAEFVIQRIQDLKQIAS